MRHNYMILKNKVKNELIIREFAETDSDLFSLLCEETYDAKAVASAIKRGKKDLLSILRTQNLYPPSFFTDKLAEMVMELYRSKDRDAAELFFDDKDQFEKDWKKTQVAQDIEFDSIEPDNFFEECEEDACSVKELSEEDLLFTSYAD